MHDDKKPKLGTGGRFKALKAKLSKKKGVKDPGAADAGRKKYGKAEFAEMAARSRMKKA